MFDPAYPTYPENDLTYDVEVNDSGEVRRFIDQRAALLFAAHLSAKQGQDGEGVHWMVLQPDGVVGGLAYHNGDVVDGALPENFFSNTADLPVSTAQLTERLNTWAEVEGLAPACALEMLMFNMDNDGQELALRQREWLVEFNALWDVVQKREEEEFYPHDLPGVAGEWS